MPRQADLVRSMKEGGAAKGEWQPHVKVLLEMKKQLESMKKATPQVTFHVHFDSKTSIARFDFETRTRQKSRNHWSVTGGYVGSQKFSTV